MGHIGRTWGPAVLLGSSRTAGGGGRRCCPEPGPETWNTEVVELRLVPCLVVEIFYPKIKLLQVDGASEGDLIIKSSFNLFKFNYC